MATMIRSYVYRAIGFHHIHHLALASRIPSYRLRSCFDENPELQQAVEQRQVRQGSPSRTRSGSSW
jgi:fatty acid desaturase